MSLTNLDLKSIIYNPTQMQHKILTELETAIDSNTGYSIHTATNPFVFLMEASVVSASAAVTETNNIVRQLYPSLADTNEDLYLHISDKEVNDLYSKPAETEIMFLINLIDLESNGYTPDGSNHKEVTIPDGTEITILGTTLTLLNDIVIKLYDNGSVFVEQQLSSNKLAYNNISILPSDITSSADGTPIIVFRTKVKQLKKTTVNKSILASQNFNNTIPITDKYCDIIVSYKNNNTNGKYLPIATTYTEKYIDVNTPTATVAVLSKSVVVRIPTPYIIENIISGNINIDVYETKGELYLPINKYKTTDFTIKLNNTGKNPSTAVSTNITMAAYSDGIIYGGKNGASIDVIRSNIIDNASNIRQLPITDKQLESYGNNLGYYIYKYADIVTGRTFIAMKGLPNFTSNLLYAKQDVYFNTCTLIIADLKDSRFIIDNNNNNNNNGNIVIKSNTIFKNNNGNLTILTEQEYQNLINLKSIFLVQHLKDNKYYYNPYYYIIEKDENYTNSRVYSLDKPKIEGNKILAKNNNLLYNSNISHYELIKSPNGYKLILKLVTNNDFNNLDKNDITLQMKILLSDNVNYAYINSEYDSVNDYYIFNIDSAMNITSDDMLDLKNGYSIIYTKRIKLNLEVFIYTLVNNKDIIDDNNFLLNEIYQDKQDYKVITKESITLTLGNRLNFIYNKLVNSYTERKFRVYEEDVLAVYEEDQYLKDPHTGSIFSCKQEGRDWAIEYNLLHKKGDPVLDPDTNEQLVKHKKGDPILDDKGNPVVDLDSGVIRYIDILLLEYEFLVANNLAYQEHRNMVLDILNHYLLNDLTTLNGILLEQTEILYKSYKSICNINVTINSSITSMFYLINPKVTLYLTGVSEVNNEIQESYKAIIGNIINKHLDNTVIRLVDIKNDIIKEIGSNIVASVKIENIDRLNNEVITIKDNLSKFTLNKLLDLNKNNELIVKYNIVLDIIFI